MHLPTYPPHTFLSLSLSPTLSPFNDPPFILSSFLSPSFPSNFSYLSIDPATHPSIHLSVFEPRYISMHPSTYPPFSLSLPAFLPACKPFHPDICLTTHLPSYPPTTHLPFFLLISPSPNPPVYLPFYLPVHSSSSHPSIHLPSYKPRYISIYPYIQYPTYSLSLPPCV